MKRLSILLITALLAMSLTACKDEPAPQAKVEPTPAPTQPAEPTPVPAAPAAASGTTGTVVETMNAAGYTYVLVNDGNEEIWAAAPEFAVNVGDQVMVPEGMAMHNYHSQTLNRDFPVVYFVESVLNASNPTAAAAAPSADMQMPEGHPPITGTPVPEEVDLSGVAKADGGLTIAEIYSGKNDLSGKEVTLRGKVVKYSPQIMGTNWIHLQDGSGDAADGSNDLTITSNVQVKVGDTVTAKGSLTLDKDFGYGYKYNLIVENAAVTVE